MKREETIELNGQEYICTLNRDSFLKIDQYSDVQKSIEIINGSLYKHYDNKDIEDGVDPFKEEITDEQLEEAIIKKMETLYKMLERAFWIWLYPKHKLNYSEVKEILKPYFEDEDKMKFICNEYGELLGKCVQVREEYNEEQKNLKAQANK